MNHDINNQFLDAASRGDSPTVRELIERGVDLEVRNAEGWTALMYATVSGHAETVELLLQLGADADAREAQGWTPLMKACLWGRVEVVNVLLRYGADIKARNDQDWTALNIAEAQGHRKIVDRLRAVQGQRNSTNGSADRHRKEPSVRISELGGAYCSEEE